MAQPDALLVPEAPEAQQETGVAEFSTNARTTGPDDDEISLVTQAHGLANGKPSFVTCFVPSMQQTR
jgi:hypothetical protein